VTVILGVGNRMRGDDAIGCLVVDELHGIEDVEAIDAGTAPENYIEPIVELAAERILIVDACAFGGKPGEYRLFGRDDLERLVSGIVSTHTLPLNMTVALLEQQLESDIHFLGVQPGTLEFDAGLSQPVEEAFDAIVEFVREWAVEAPPSV
jgi:hydrogenase 3 maturation protease